MTSTDPSFGALQPGTTFHGRYRVARRINAGGMGAIFEVVDVKTNSRRALKVMLPTALGDSDFRARFESEALITGPIDSDHLVRVSDAGVDVATDMPFIVMDLLQGEDLGAVLQRRQTLPPEEVVLYLSQAARALEKTHAAGVVHRDLKPENLFLTRRDDGSPCIKLLDFGIAKMVNSTKDARATRAIGTPFYMSPEQIGGDGAIGPRADIYSMGHIAYTLLSGEPYWFESSTTSATPYALVVQVLRGIAEPPCDRALRRGGVLLPPAFDPWFLKITALDPASRFEHAHGAVAALAAALDVQAGAGAPAAAPSAAPPVPLPAPAASAVSVPVGPVWPSPPLPAQSRSTPLGSAAYPTQLSHALPTDPIQVLPARPAAADAGGAPARPRAAMWIALALMGLVGVVVAGRSLWRRRTAHEVPHVAAQHAEAAPPAATVTAEPAPGAVPGAPAASASMPAPAGTATTAPLPAAPPRPNAKAMPKVKASTKPVEPPQLIGRD